MGHNTTMRDNQKTLLREAWQNGKCVYTWSKQEIEKINTESATCPAWGCYPSDRPGSELIKRSLK